VAEEPAVTRVIRHLRGRQAHAVDDAVHQLVRQQVQRHLQLGAAGEPIDQGVGGGVGGEGGRAHHQAVDGGEAQLLRRALSGWAAQLEGGGRQQHAAAAGRPALAVVAHDVPAGEGGAAAGKVLVARAASAEPQRGQKVELARRAPLDCHRRIFCCIVGGYRFAVASQPPTAKCHLERHLGAFDDPFNNGREGACARNDASVLQ
jgi:hypothetical protein